MNGSSPSLVVNPMIWLMMSRRKDVECGTAGNISSNIQPKVNKQTGLRLQGTTQFLSSMLVEMCKRKVKKRNIYIAYNLDFILVRRKKTKTN